MKYKFLSTRKNIRLNKFDYKAAGYYFITLCVDGGHMMLGRVVVETAMNEPNAGDCVGTTVPGRPFTKLSDIGKIVDDAIQYYNKTADGFIFDKYIIMPNHIHAIVKIKTDDRGRSSLQNIVRKLKSFVTKQIGFSLWQRRFHDHIIRDNDDYNRICYYIKHNPSTWANDCYFININ